MVTALFQPLRIRSLALKNRIVISPMMQHAAPRRPGHALAGRELQAGHGHQRLCELGPGCRVGNRSQPHIAIHQRRRRLAGAQIAPVGDWPEGRRQRIRLAAGLVQHHAPQEQPGRLQPARHHALPRPIRRTGSAQGHRSERAMGARPVEARHGRDTDRREARRQYRRTRDQWQASCQRAQRRGARDGWLEGAEHARRGAARPHLL